MTTCKTIFYERDELREFGIELQEGLEQMIGFERELTRYGKSTLILFIVLNLDIEQFGRAQKIMDQLELLYDDPE